MAIPNFFVIGAQKCGTSALYQALGQHPQIRMSRNKEPFFFIMDGALPEFRLPTPGYASRLVFDWERYQQLFEPSEGRVAIGEASAIYLSSYYPERTAQRIRQRIPHARMIALLRQPAERAWSAYQFYHARGIEPAASFEEALRAEPERLRNGECPDIRHRQNGCYHANLKPWFDTFPKEQIRVFLFEDWLGEPDRTLRDACRFLGVDETVRLVPKRVNETTLYRSRRLGRAFINPSRGDRLMHHLLPDVWLDKLRRWNEVKPPVMPASIRRELTLGYREDILALQSLIGRDLSHWLGEPAGRILSGGEAV